VETTSVNWDLPAIARKWQKQWADSGCFVPQAKPDAPKFFFTVPYPYVSGLLHTGHGRTYTNGDVMARFRRMQGYNVLWPMAFHITGTPVLAVSARIKAGDEATIKLFEEYVSVYEKDEAKVKEIVQSFSEPWNVVNYFSVKLVGDFASMGYSLDFTRQFTSGDKEYNRFIQWQFLKYQQKGLVKQASYPLLYCVNDQNAVGEDDIKDGDSDPVEVQKFVAEKFLLEGDCAFIVSSTLRPETVFGITNEFVNPDAQYSLIKVESPDGKGSEQWFVSSQAAQKLARQNLSVTVIKQVPGEFFVGKYCTTPIGKRVPILPAGFVDPENASGFVHSVPAHAPHDYAAIEELKHDELTLQKYSSVNLKGAVDSIVPISVVVVEGYGQYPAEELCKKMGIVNTRDHTKLDKATRELYKAEFYGGKLKENCGQFAGESVQDSKDNVTNWLKAQGKAADFFETSRPAVCRCGGQVVAAVMSDQWFIDFNSPGWKDLANECLARMQIYPAGYRKQFQDVFAWLDKRPCARRRGLGTQLPFNNEWIIESLSDSTIYPAFYTIIKEIRKAGLKPEQLTPAFFDYVFLGIGEPVSVVKETGCSAESLEAIRKEFLYWYPVDQRHTGIAHITNHLSFYIFAHTAIFPKQHWPKAITLNELVISEGTKMSKSRGNVVLLNYVASALGPDVFRLYAVGSADLASVLDYRAKEVETTRRVLTRFANHISELQDLRGKNPQQSGVQPAINSWFASKFEGAVGKCTKSLEEYRLRDYVQAALFSLLNDLDYFLRRCNEQEKARLADSDIPQRWVQLLAPVIPHLCEELWARGNGSGLVSISSWPKENSGLIRPEVDASEDLVMQVAFDMRKIKDMLKGRKLSNALVITSSKTKAEEFYNCLSASSPEEVSGKTTDEFLKGYVQKNFFELKAKEQALRAMDGQQVLAAAADFLSKEVGLQVNVARAEGSTDPKAARALPGKPALVLA
jgi:leucyl-tRNA synthetase